METHGSGYRGCLRMRHHWPFPPSIPLTHSSAPQRINTISLNTNKSQVLLLERSTFITEDTYYFVIHRRRLDIYKLLSSFVLTHEVGFKNHGYSHERMKKD